MSSQTLRLDYAIHVDVRTPKVLLPLVWPLPLSLATTRGISVDFFSSPYLDVSVQAVSFIRLFDSPYDDRAYPAGFPHSEIHGSMSAFDSPWLIADCCVLRRLLVPRHSPCALCSLTIFESLVLLKLTLDDNLIVVVTLKLFYLSLLLHFLFVQFSRCIPDACASVMVCLATNTFLIPKNQGLASSHTPLLAYVVLDRF